MSKEKDCKRSYVIPDKPADININTRGGKLKKSGSPVLSILINYNDPSNEESTRLFVDNIKTLIEPRVKKIKIQDEFEGEIGVRLAFENEQDRHSALKKIDQHINQILHRIDQESGRRYQDKISKKISAVKSMLKAYQGRVMDELVINEIADKIAKPTERER